MEDNYILLCPHCNKEFEYSWALKLNDEIWCPHCECYVTEEIKD